MTVLVQGPDGLQYQFPDGTDKAAAIAYFKKRGIGVKAPEATPPKKGIWDSYDEAVAPLVTTTPHNLKSLLPQKSRGGAYDPKAYLHEAGTAVSNIGAGGFGLILHPVNTVGGILKTAWHSNPAVNLVEEGNSLRTGKPSFGQEMAEQAVNAPLETAETMAGQAAVLDVAGRAIPAAKAAPGKVGEILRGKYGPRQIEVGSEKVPVTVGEANPESPAGRMQTSLKRSGAGAAQFEKVEKAQQDAAKNVIKKTAQKASGFIGPMQEEAGAVVDDAATASFRKAEPLYNELDTSLKNVPASFKGVSKIVQDAIGRARKLGVSIADEGGDISKIAPDKNGAIQWGGSKISKVTHPERWQKLVDEGIIDDSGNSTPFKAYRTVRSQLLKMQRAATDSQVRFAIGNEIKTMDTNIDAALKGTGLEKSWAEANRLWREGKARIEVAKAITDSTKGTPESAQAPGMAKVPTKLQGASLVDKLNTLADDGTLGDAFKPDEIRNLRQAADILDRIQKTPVGRGAGESMSLARGLTHAVRGYKGPMIGAGIGAGVGALSGEMLRGAEVGAGMGFIVQSIGERALVNVMTKLDGVKALKAVEDAKTPAEMKTAIDKLAIVAAAAAPKKRVAAALTP